MNPQFEGQVRPQGPFMPQCSQPYPSNAFEAQSGQSVNKGFLPVGVQNAPPNSFPGPIQNQSSPLMQSSTVHPNNHMVNNQMSQDFNSMRISQNQNNALLTNNHPVQRPSPTPNQNPPPNQGMAGQQQYWQQPPIVSSGQFQNPNPTYPPTINTNSMPYQKPPYSTEKGQSLPPYTPNYNNYAPNPPIGDQHYQQQQPQHGQQPYQLPNSKPVYPPPMVDAAHPPIHNERMYQQPLPTTNDQLLYPPSSGPRTLQPQSLNRMPLNDNFGPPNQQRQSRQPSPYTNGYGGDSAPSVNNFNHLNSNLPARFPPQQIVGPTQGGMLPAGPHYGQPPGSAQQVTQPQAQTRKLDPDHMPSPIQVIEDDRKLRSCAFSTAQRGLVPPLVTTNFTVIDEGICSPRFIRSTIYNVPTTAEVLKQTSVPFALAISPFSQVHQDEHPPHVIDTGEEGPVRCHRCRAYMSPFMQFIDAGRRFQCVLCKTATEVPAHYFCHLDHMGQRADRLERAELCLGSYEFIVNKDYCKEGKFPNCPAFIFLIDVSYNSVRSGMVQTLCANMKNVLANLPREDDTAESKLRVGFVTYSTAVHFYNINSNLAQPQELVVSDVHDMFMPLLDGFLVNPSESAHVIDSLMAQIPTMFADTKETETVLGPAIQAGLEALKAAECAGKLFIFHSTLPIAEAPGKLKNRDDRKLLGTDKEKTVLTPQTTFYNNLGQECVKSGCSVDLFLFNNAYIDIATIGQVCRLTGGQVFKYTYFQADIDGERFIEDLCRDVEKPIAFDAVLRVRTSTGIRPTEFTGSFFMSNTTDVELAAVTCDQSLAIEIKYDDKLAEEDGVCIQCAILYTSVGGQRRLRVHNLALNTCSQMAELFRNCELDTILNILLKEGIRKVADESPKQIKEYLLSRSAQVLACYRKNCAQASSAGQLILPECMKLLPLYINCLIKCDALNGGQEISVDDRSFIMLTALNMDVDSSAAYLYPRLIPLHDIKPEPENVQIPTAIRCSIERLKDNGIYLIENGLSMFLWIGMNSDAEWIQEVFGVPTVARIDIDKTSLLQLNNPLSQCIHAILRQIQNERQRYMKLCIVRQGDKLELLFRQLLVEDKTTEGSASYVDFLCHLHKEIRLLLS